MNFEFYLNQKNNKNLYFDGYYYNLKTLNEIETQWRCINRKCFGICVIINSECSIIKKHNHEKDCIKIKLIKLKLECKKRAIETRDNPRTILTDLSPILNDDEIFKMSRFKTITDGITKERNKQFANFKVEIQDIPRFLQITLRNEQFLQFDSGIFSESRFVIFLSPFAINCLKKVKTLIIDGTFYSSPSSFYQILIIHGQVFRKVVPLVYVFCSGKEQKDYEDIFLKVKNLTCCEPTMIVVDMEIAQFNAIKKIFFNAKIKACIFHFGQAIWRKIQKLSLVFEYKNNKEVYRIIRMLINLCFVPEICVVTEFFRIIESIDVKVKEVLNSFILYFQNNFIGFYKMDIMKKEPRFSISFWNLHYNVINLLPRSTNSAEAYHQNLNRMVETAHPNLAKIITIFQQDEESTRIKIIQEKKSISYDTQQEKKSIILKIGSDNFNFYKGFEFYSFIESIYNWKFND